MTLCQHMITRSDGLFMMGWTHGASIHGRASARGAIEARLHRAVDVGWARHGDGGQEGEKSNGELHDDSGCWL